MFCCIYYVLFCMYKVIPYRLYPMSIYSSSYVPVRFLSVCHRGYFNCSYSPCPAVCTVYSDRHYHTFDGLEYDYYSDCQVYLLKVSRCIVCVDLRKYSVTCANKSRMCKNM